MTSRERGFTLIELMIAMLVSSLLVGSLFAIFIRISTATRAQQQLASLQQMLSGARATIEGDAKQAGLLMSQGFTLGSSGALTLRAPVVVVDGGSSGPDQVGFYYADPTVQAAVPSGAATATKLACDVDSTVGFAVGDLVVMSTAATVSSPINPGVDASIATFQACVLSISGLTATRLTFSTSAPWGSTLNAHCSDLPTLVPSRGRTMFFKLVAAYYRIDPARPADGVLQVSRTGNLAGLADWQDLGYGFTDLQIATRVFDNDALDSADPDTDPLREWHSGGTQTTLTQAAATLVPPIQMSISLVARTDRDVEGVATALTPKLTIDGNPNNNNLGNRVQDTLPSVSNPALQGSRIYRHTTFMVDFRNLGVGR